MPRSDPGSSRGAAGGRRRRGGGFTLIEVMVVIALIAVAAGAATLALRDNRDTRLEREAARLTALLETARAEARAAGAPVQWMLTPESGEHQFRFVGLPASRTLPTRWLDGAVLARIGDDRPTVVLGPEAIIGRQRVTLRIESQSIEIGTDGLQPFAVLASRTDEP